MIAYSNGENLPIGFVTETYFFLWNNDEIIGQFRIRHYLCESLIEGAGHIGYYIGKKFRGKGYATEGLRLALQVGKSIISEDEIYLRVNKDNLVTFVDIISKYQCMGFYASIKNIVHTNRLALRE